MAVTLTTASQRDVVRERGQGLTVATSELALAATSFAAILLFALTYAGSFRLEGLARAAAHPVANLNTVTDTTSLERALEGVLPGSGDRQLAARELLAFLQQPGGERRTVPNVGAISRARVASSVIESSAFAPGFRERLQEERARAKAAGRQPPESLPLLTSAQITQVKPLLTVRERGEMRGALVFWAALYLLAFHAVALIWRIRKIPGDRVLLTAAHALTALGFAAMISRPDPLRDTLLFVRYAQGVLAGVVVASAVSLVRLRTSPIQHLSYLPLALAFALSLLLLSPLGSGPSGSGAKVNLGPFQPIEAIRILMALFLAGYFARNWELLRAVRGDRVGSIPLPAWMNVPSARYLVPVLVGVAGALALFFIQRDLGPALMLAVVFLSAYGVARGRIGLVLLGAALLAAGFFVGYQLEISSTLADRMRMWRAPWDNVARGGDQIAQALWSMSSGGGFGAGLGLGETRYLPAGHTDLVLASIAEELGFAGLLVVALIYTAIMWRALSIARNASSDFGFFLALILALSLGVPVLLMAAGSLGVVPLTGVVTPFLSFGGSAMVANFTALGLLASIRSDRAPRADLESLIKPLRWLGGALALPAAVLLIAAARVQVMSADELLVRPYLGMQADGMRRFQYNPRILELARRIPRGTIADRNGLPLATDDRTRLKTAAPAFNRLGIAVESVCADAPERCYPLGGAAFHVIGDAVSRANWSATNTSFVERDREARLRGFDDRPVLVPIVERDGTPNTALRRDYTGLVDVYRHRFDDDHPVTQAALDATRELRLTIDARLQSKTAGIVAEYARRSATGRAAAVAVDTATGEVLASVSYPWPAAGEIRRLPAPGEPPIDAFLDRARYGQYPPGSTFKLITAAAALRRDAGAAAATFTCSRLPDGRVGARVPGYSRPIRDDIKDRDPHGTIAMHRALVVSCNAYFAQLAARIGPRALLDAATAAEISVARNDSIPRVRDTLPQAGYGQGDVLASPLRMATVAAAIASDGKLRDGRFELDAPAPAARDLLSRDAARTLASSMRATVVEGTGRSVRGAPVAIAGKTGTAEVDGAPSHSWFVGFAPYGQATRRVAVAVILENAGYGGAGAAPAAGEILAAAASIGLAR
jgi:cell division protein FtsW (lipid II flippase)